MIKGNGGNILLSIVGMGKRAGLSPVEGSSPKKQALVPGKKKEGVLIS